MIKIEPENKKIKNAKLMVSTNGNEYIDFKDENGKPHMVKVSKKNHTFIYRNIKYTINYNNNTNNNTNRNEKE